MIPDKEKSRFNELIDEFHKNCKEHTVNREAKLSGARQCTKCGLANSKGCSIEQDGTRISDKIRVSSYKLEFDRCPADRGLYALKMDLCTRCMGNLVVTMNAVVTDFLKNKVSYPKDA